MGIEARGQFIEDDDWRIVDQREHDEEALLLPAGERTERCISLVVYFPPLQQWLSGDRMVVKGGKEPERLGDAQPVLQCGLLELNPDLLTDRVGLLLWI